MNLVVTNQVHLSELRALDKDTPRADLNDWDIYAWAPLPRPDGPALASLWFGWCSTSTAKRKRKSRRAVQDY